jgi:predicted permease
MRRSPVVDDRVRDVRYGIRQLWRQPGSSVVIILTLALGIGANTAIFAVVDAVFLRRLPVAHPEQLVLFSGDPFQGSISGSTPEGAWALFSSESYEFLRASELPFSSVGAFTGADTVAMRVLDSAESESSAATSGRAELVSGNYFDVMGVTAALGRMLTATDDRPGAAPVAVISDPYWRNVLHGSSNAVGKSVRVNRTVFTIVGVAPPPFFGERVSTPPDFWVPLARQPDIQLRESVLVRPDYYWLSLIGRLAPGQPRAAAEIAATTALRRFLTTKAGSVPDEASRTSIRRARVAMVSGARGVSPVRQRDAKSLTLLSASVGLVLLIACANVATLLLCRAVARNTEVAVRRALGASRLHLVRQGLTEALMLATFGAVAGVLLAHWLAPTLLSFFPAGPIRTKTAGPVLLFAIGLTVLASGLSGLAPALQVGRTDALAALRSSGRSSGARRRYAFGATEPFIVAQMAFSLVLALGATLFARSLFNLEREPLGFDQERVLVTRINPRIAGYTPANVGSLYRRLYDRVATLPGIESATFARYSPFSGSRSIVSATVDGYTPAPGERVGLETVPVGPNYPATIGMTLLAGRAIAVTDDAGAPLVAMVNEAFAHHFFPASSALGHSFHANAQQHYEIVGVVRDALFHSARDQATPVVFTSMLQETSQRALDCEIAIRAHGEAASLAPLIRQVVAQTDSRVGVRSAATLREQVLSTLAPERTAAGFVSAFAGLALLVAAVGLYGVVSHRVARRTKELGVRLALGAPPGAVVWLIAKEALVWVVMGITLGGGGAILMGRLVADQLFGVTPADPGSFLVAVAILGSVALLASLVPAVRALRVDPIAALRME